MEANIVGTVRSGYFKAYAIADTYGISIEAARKIKLREPFAASDAGIDPETRDKLIEAGLVVPE